MDQLNIEEIKDRTTTGILFLTLRNFGIQAISVLGFFLLTIILGTGDVGLFAIVAESIGILGYFSDIGLASALIQKKETPTREELQTTFTIQQLLVVLSLVVASIVYQQIAGNKNYGSREFLIMLSLCYSFAAASLKTIPSILLERELNFKLISTVDIIENLTFYLVAVVFAVLGFGAYSYAIAVFIRSSLGLILIYRLKAWDMGFSFSFATVKRLFTFGIPFQLNSFIAVAKDRLSSLFVAGILGRNAFGLISWAQKGPRVPLSFMDAIMRVTFPTFSRIQDNRELLKRSIEKTTFYISFFIFPSLVILSFVAKDLVYLIPRYTKWAPALIPLYLYAVGYAIAAVTTPLTNAFNATGHISVTTRFMIMWTVLTWALYPPLSLRFGYTGTAIASLIVSLSSLIVWLYCHRLFGVNLFSTIKTPTIGTLLLLFALLAVNSIQLNHLVNLLVTIIVALIIYIPFQLFFARVEVNWFYHQVKCRYLKK